MKKAPNRLISILLIIIMLAGCLFTGIATTAAAADQGSISNFSKRYSYSNTAFNDVESAKWYYSSIKSVYEYGLMNGKSSGFFDVDGYVTIAESLTIAARLNSIYYNADDKFQSSSPWYQVYVDYCSDQGVLKESFADYNVKASREVFASILAYALPESELQQINQVSDGKIPDVSTSSKYYYPIYMLYRAGITVGNDSAGTFSPKANIKRSEVAAIVARIVDKSLRKSITLVDVKSVGGNYVFDYSTIPEYSDSATVILNGNIPCFSPEDFNTTVNEQYSELDFLGRCGPAFAKVGLETIPQTVRTEISGITPTGWVQAEYDLITNKQLYNRSHLIAYSLTAENANDRNLITGTDYLNKEVMPSYEEAVRLYVENTGNHVLYRATPVFYGSEMVARGVHLEAYSIEDDGQGVCFNVFCYNVQPGIEIDYATGASLLAATSLIADNDTGSGNGSGGTKQTGNSGNAPDDYKYVLNLNTHKFHKRGCGEIGKMKEKNKYYFSGTRDEAIAMGYSPCKKCNP